MKAFKLDIQNKNTKQHKDGAYKGYEGVDKRTYNGKQLWSRTEIEETSKESPDTQCGNKIL